MGAYVLLAGGPPFKALEDCARGTAFDVDFAPEVVQPTPEEALAWFLAEVRARPRAAPRAPLGDYERAAATEGPLAQVDWRLVNERNEEVARLITEEWPDGGWTVIGGAVCWQREPSSW